MPWVCPIWTTAALRLTRPGCSWCHDAAESDYYNARTGNGWPAGLLTSMHSVMKACTALCAQRCGASHILESLHSSAVPYGLHTR